MSVVVLLRGPVDDAKLDVLEDLADRFDLLPFYAGEFEDSPASEPSLKKRRIEAHEQCWVEVQKAVQAGHPVIVGDSFSKRHYMSRYIKLAKQMGAPVIIVSMPDASSMPGWEGHWDEVTLAVGTQQLREVGRE